MTTFSRTRRALAATLAVGAVGAAVALPSGAQAAAVGQVCNTNSPTPVYGYPNNVGWIYTIAAGDGFRIRGFGNGLWYGHGNGGPDGWIDPSHINQPTCHFD
jgi:hypothetical protein